MKNGLSRCARTLKSRLDIIEEEIHRTHAFDTSQEVRQRSMVASLMEPDMVECLQLGLDIVSLEPDDLEFLAVLSY